MAEFMMIFRNDYNPDFKASPEQMQASIKQWQDWIGGIAAQGKFINTNRLGLEAKTLKANHMVTDGPYAEVKEIVGGYVLVRAENLEEALGLADACPILSIGGSVEIRNIMSIPQ